MIGQADVAVVAQVPLDPGWVTYLMQGGAAAGILFTTVMMLWYQDKERKAERKHRERVTSQFVASQRVANICILENAEQSARCSLMLDALTPFVKKTLNPSASQVVSLAQIEALKKELIKEHEEQLAKEAKASLVEEESDEDK
jgi:adenosyl cobinamide kinase/adenosyl cobinamide phosphate guanylyltransferase